MAAHIPVAARVRITALVPAIKAPRRRARRLRLRELRRPPLMRQDSRQARPPAMRAQPALEHNGPRHGLTLPARSARPGPSRGRSRPAGVARSANTRARRRFSLSAFFCTLLTGRPPAPAATRRLRVWKALRRRGRSSRCGRRSSWHSFSGGNNNAGSGLPKPLPRPRGPSPPLPLNGWPAAPSAPRRLRGRLDAPRTPAAPARPRCGRGRAPAWRSRGAQARP
jgi:hypothetical protein